MPPWTRVSPRVVQPREPPEHQRQLRARFRRALVALHGARVLTPRSAVPALVPAARAEHRSQVRAFEGRYETAVENGQLAINAAIGEKARRDAHRLGSNCHRPLRAAFGCRSASDAPRGRR